MPVVLIALLKFSEFGVHLFKARDGSSTWYFRFSPKAVLQVRDDGDWCWRQGTERWRREIAPFLARAEALLAEGGDDSGLADARVDGGPGSGEQPEVLSSTRMGRAPAIGGVGLYAPLLPPAPGARQTRSPPCG